MEYIPQENLSCAFKAFQLAQSGPPRLWRRISLTQSQLIMDFNRIYEIASPQHLGQSLTNWALQPTPASVETDHHSRARRQAHGYKSVNLLLRQFHEEDFFTFFFFPSRRKQLAQGHTAERGKSWDLTPGWLQCVLLPTFGFCFMT